MNFTVETALQVLAALPAFVKLIRDLMGAAQTAFDKGTGPDKKAAVLAGVEAVIDNDSVWQKMQKFFSGLVDFIAIFKKKDPATVQAPEPAAQ